MNQITIVAKQNTTKFHGKLSFRIYDPQLRDLVLDAYRDYLNAVLTSSDPECTLEHVAVETLATHRLSTTILGKDWQRDFGHLTTAEYKAVFERRFA